MFDKMLAKLAAKIVKYLFRVGSPHLYDEGLIPEQKLLIKTSQISEIRLNMVQEVVNVLNTIEPYLLKSISVIEDNKEQIKENTFGNQLIFKYWNDHRNKINSMIKEHDSLVVIQNELMEK
jgi:hypothetical protein